MAEYHIKPRKRKFWLILMEDLPIVTSSFLGSGALAFFIMGMIAAGLFCLVILVIAESYFTVKERK